MTDTTDTTETSEFEELLEYLRKTRGFEFRAYKRPSLVRRIRRRMDAIGIASYSEYQHYLESEPDEFVQLFNTVLINVTNFFRDSLPWQYLAEHVIPQVLEQKRKFDPIRIWSAGCATGEEAYTLAMILAETMGVDGYRGRVKIYATDVDEDALATARMGSFDPKDVEDIPPVLLEKYFERTNGRYTFRKELRRCVIFGRHDLLQDAPISRVDILVCRNTLMYFNGPAQARILARLHFAMNEGGFLFLGKAETLLAHSATFKPVELRHRVFMKVTGPRLSPPVYLMSPGNSPGPFEAHQEDIRDAAIRGSGGAQLIVDRGGDLLLANDKARSLFRISGRDMGKAFHDLEVSYRPLELRSKIEQAYIEQRSVTVRGIEFRANDSETLWLDVEIVPLMRKTGEITGVTINFSDVTIQHRLQEALERVNGELENAYEQLQSTNEEMETTNEELQSTVEELETTNEELQATNEELETMNEELQSTNEELQEINDIARAYTRELDSANHFLESIFSGLGHRVIVVDRGLNVLVWNHGAEDLWGIRADEAVNAALPDLDIGLPLKTIKPDIDSILSHKSDIVRREIQATNRRGKKVELRVTLAPLNARDDDGVGGVIILTDDKDGAR